MYIAIWPKMNINIEIDNTTTQQFCVHSCVYALHDCNIIPCMTNIWTTRGARIDTPYINNFWGFIKHILTFWWSRKVTKQVVNKSMRSYKHVQTTLLVIIIISTSTLYNKFTVITYIPVCTCCCLFFHKVRSDENKIHNQQ